MNEKLNTHYFECLWLNDHQFSDRNADFWNLRAEEYNQSVSKDRSVMSRENKVQYFVEKSLINSESTVLDIGCGSGQLAIAHARVVKKVVAMDFSEKMLGFAKENAKKAGVDNIQFVLSDWEHFPLEEPFDFVIASMSPAINSSTGLYKMMAACRGSCYLSAFVDRYSSLKEKLYKLTDQVYKRQYDIINYVFNILWINGYLPELTYEMGYYERILTIEKAKESYALDLGVNKIPLKIKLLETFFDQEKKEGFIKEIVNQTKGELIWKCSHLKIQKSQSLDDK